MSLQISNRYCHCVSVYVVCLHESLDMLEFCISGWNRMLQPYIESATAL